MSAYTEPQLAYFRSLKNKFDDLPAYIGEMNRMIALKKQTAETAEMKMRIPMMIMMLRGITEKSESMINHETFYKIANIYLAGKIKFWEGVIRGEIPNGMLEMLQEELTDFVEAGWVYWGMERFKDEGDTAKMEFEFYKKMCAIFSKVPTKKNKKKNGKKNRNKN
tara:strand:- start:131 stop:625 length:495 start_codon:yes stop_codon:yes gene_type:complete